MSFRVSVWSQVVDVELKLDLEGSIFYFNLADDDYPE